MANRRLRPSRATVWARAKRRQEIARRGGQCEICGTQVRLQFAHVEPTGVNGDGRGSVARIQDVLRHPQSYRLLCVDCHAVVDTRLSEGEPGGDVRVDV